MREDGFGADMVWGLSIVPYISRSSRHSNVFVGVLREKDRGQLGLWGKLDTRPRWNNRGLRLLYPNWYPRFQGVENSNNYFMSVRAKPEQLTASLDQIYPVHQLSA